MFNIRTYDSDIEPHYTTSIVARQRRLPSGLGKRLGKMAGGQVTIGLQFERRLGHSNWVGVGSDDMPVAPMRRAFWQYWLMDHIWELREGARW